jgi:Xaa-Pro aminopeptidase
MALPESEKTKRIEKTRRLAEEKGLDFIFVYYDEYNVMNGRYLTGYCPTIERGAVIVSNHCEPFLIGGPEAGPYAQLESAIKETVACPVFMVPEEEYPSAELLNFRQISEAYFGGRKIRRIGLVGSNAVPYLIYSQLIADLDGAEIVDVTDDFEHFRYVKSQWEIEQMRRAYEIADEAFPKMVMSIVEGKREYEAAAEAEYIARKMGSDGLGYRTIIGTAERSRGIVPVYSDRVFAKGEIVITGFAPLFNGYSATACYPVVVGGEPDEMQATWTEDICEALRLTREALEPGLSGREIDSVPRKYLLGRGYGPYMLMPYVHNSGLCEFERPFFGPGSDDIIQENQVVCIDIALFGNPQIPGIRVETGYLVTADGAVPMSRSIEHLLDFGCDEGMGLGFAN